MRRFFCLRARKALIRAFWERWGVVSTPEGPLPPFVVRDASLTSSSDVSDECAAEREYLKSLATWPSDEDLLKWVLREEPWDFVPPGYL